MIATANERRREGEREVGVPTGMKRGKQGGGGSGGGGGGGGRKTGKSGKSGGSGRGRRPRNQWEKSEEEALREGVREYGTGAWKRILTDPRFAKRLSRRKNVDLKDKWRVINGRGGGQMIHGVNIASTTNTTNVYDTAAAAAAAAAEDDSAAAAAAAAAKVHVGVRCKKISVMGTRASTSTGRQNTANTPGSTRSAALPMNAAQRSRVGMGAAGEGGGSARQGWGRGGGGGARKPVAAAAKQAAPAPTPPDETKAAAAWVNDMDDEFGDNHHDDLSFDDDDDEWETLPLMARGGRNLHGRGLGLKDVASNNNLTRAAVTAAATTVATATTSNGAAMKQRQKLHVMVDDVPSDDHVDTFALRRHLYDMRHHHNEESSRANARVSPGGHASKEHSIMGCDLETPPSGEYDGVIAMMLGDASPKGHDAGFYHQQRNASARNSPNRKRTVSEAGFTWDDDEEEVLLHDMTMGEPRVGAHLGAVFIGEGNGGGGGGGGGGGASSDDGMTRAPWGAPCDDDGTACDASCPVSPTGPPLNTTADWEQNLSSAQTRVISSIRVMLRRCRDASEQLPTCVSEVWAHIEALHDDDKDATATRAPWAVTPKTTIPLINLIVVYRLGGEWDERYRRFVWLLRSLNELKQLKGSRVLEGRRLVQKSRHKGARDTTKADGEGNSIATASNNPTCPPEDRDEDDQDQAISIDDLFAMNAAYARPLDALDDATRVMSPKKEGEIVHDNVTHGGEVSVAASPVASSFDKKLGAAGIDDNLIISEIVDRTEAFHFRNWVSTLDWDMCESASDALHTPSCKGCQEHMTSRLLLAGLSPGIRISNMFWRGETDAVHMSSSQCLRGRAVQKIWARDETRTSMRASLESAMFALVSASA